MENEFGSTTGPAHAAVAGLICPSLKYSIMINGVDAAVDDEGRCAQCFFR